MPAFRLSSFTARLLVPAAALLAFTAGPADAAALGKSPRLTIDEKACATGAAPEQRSLTVTATAVLRGTGDRVALRFTAQQRGPGASKWTRVQAAPGGLGQWEIGQPGGVGLNYAKTLASLAEETRYRLVVEARGLSSAGKVATKTAKRTVPCNQPRQNPDVRLQRVVHVAGSDSAGDALLVTVQNAGLLPAGKSRLTLKDAAGATVATKELPALKGKGRRTVKLPIATCTSGMELVVEPLAGADGEPETSDHVVKVSCATGKQARKASKPRSRR